jgi:hypothetical protein
VAYIGGKQMLCAFPRFTRGQTGKLIFVLAGALTLIAFTTDTSLAQRRTAAGEPENQPAFSEFKGVRLGMKTDEARKKLGSPTDKGAEQDFYVFNDTQAVQVYYDKAGVVNAISIDFMNGATAIPSAKEVLGAEAEAKADGSAYKMVRYPKAGYWVSYSRTAGSSPTITVTMQRIDH